MVPTDYKVLEVIAPAAIVDAAAFTSNVIDTLGADFLEIIVHFGAMDIAVSAMKLTEAEIATNGTTLDAGTVVDITASIVGTAALDTGVTSALPSASADNTYFKYEIDLRGRKRYIKLNLTGGDGSAGTYAEATAMLKRLEKVPVTAAQKGCAQVMRI